MTVSYEARMVDTWNCLSYLATRTITGRCLLILFLIVPFVGPVAALYLTVPGSKAEHLMAEAFIPDVFETYIGISFFTFLGLVLGPWVTPLITITIDPQFCHRQEFGDGKSSWRSFSTLIEEANYFYFMGACNVYYIPKSAFDSRAEAEVFFQTALAYWRDTKGIPPPPIPETAGVWPPAPRPTNSAEPGDTQ